MPENRVSSRGRHDALHFSLQLSAKPADEQRLANCHRLYLQNVAISRDQLVEHRADDTAQEQARENSISEE